MLIQLSEKFQENYPAPIMQTLNIFRDAVTHNIARISCNHHLIVKLKSFLSQLNYHVYACKNNIRCIIHNIACMYVQLCMYLYK